MQVMLEPFRSRCPCSRAYSVCTAEGELLPGPMHRGGLGSSADCRLVQVCRGHPDGGAVGGGVITVPAS